ncbi:SMI1/KNR4 family protein [Amycolatopsis sp. BJA-103]|uniref:SMI1/KNR4 family protein n=1 Tax=Amycolatopsis sp. BJA-103 TaxID=1911175 RepID=UPI000C791AB1|nr:SMI1/KNR4 family protein [Amycolatopsis sp. BJA-103]AUI57106.1 SMI1/KNR4 family protein [Amycolatopsis sp. BJA-103]PNE15383.1 SMI1/KNR4 family protein [Amycolatopsis sp. BJA-103]
MNPGDIAGEMARLLHDSTKTTFTSAVLRIHNTGGGFSLQAETDTGRYLSPDMTALSELFRPLPPSIYEVRLSHTGEYTFLATPDVGTMSPAWLVFDDGFRYPGHPLPGLPLPVRSRPTGAPTDPAVLARITALATEFAGLYEKIKGHAPDWEPGRTEAELAEAEARIGARLPEDLRALFRVTGWDNESGLLGRYAHDPLPLLVERYLDGVPGSYGWEDPVTEEGVVFETQPAGRVKRLSRNDWWITFGSDHAGDFLAVDLDPAEDGESGQILEYGRNVWGPIRYVAASITGMMEEVVRALKAGEYDNDEPDSPYLIAEAAFHDESARGHDQVLTETTDLGGVADPELVQELYLNDPGSVDLAILNPLSSLRHLRVNRADSVVADLSGFPALEAASIETAKVDLTGIAGHPALWGLSLAGVKHPIDFGPLLGLPGLIRLGLAGLDVPELERVGELASLRVLTLDDGQVRRLLDAGVTLPSLAAIEITGGASLAEIVRLRRRLRPDGPAPEVIEASGTLAAP